MKLGIYSICDARVGFTGSLMADMNDASAMRNFENAVLQPNTIYSTHAKDYDLYRLGEYDTEDGTIVTHPKKLLLNGSAVIRTHSVSYSEEV